VCVGTSGSDGRSSLVDDKDRDQKPIIENDVTPCNVNSGRA